MTSTAISMEISSTSPSPDIMVRVFLNEQEILSTTAADLPAKLAHEFNDGEGTHCLRLEMSGKSMDHTQVDEQGNILQDVLINFNNFEFDGVNIDQLAWQLARYEHNFNGTKDACVDQFFGTMGCNGSVKLEFTSPVYLWLLENL